MPMKLQRAIGLLAIGLVWCVCAAHAQPSAPPDNAASDEAAQSVPALEARLSATPILYQFATERLHTIFEAGQRLGNRADVFTTVGDSNTANGDFMQPLGLPGALCDLGEYGTLQTTLDYFQTPPVSAAAGLGAPNSFAHRSVAARRALGSAGALDPFWSDATCQPRESPVACEYRETRPSVAIILLGQIDINTGGADLDFYRANMAQILQFSIDQGVIPVLTTLVYLPERAEYATSLRFNGALLDLAESYQTPLINLWAAAQALPNVGIGPDRSHLSAQVGRFCTFDGSENELGGTLRNLITLQALESLRVGVLDAP